MAWGRLALIHAAGESPEVLDKMAELWGYEYKPETKTDEPYKPPLDDQTIPAKLDNEPIPSRPPAKFIVVSKLQSLPTTDSNAPSYLNEPDILEPDTQGSYCFPAAKPLLNMARLVPLLHNGLGQKRKGTNINLTRLSALVAKGKTFKKLPYLPRLLWTQRLQIIVDARSDLEPFWNDFIFIIHGLKKILGQEAVTSIRFDEHSLTNEQAYCIAYPQHDHAQWTIWQVPPDDVAILILSDLKPKHWHSLLKRLQPRSAPLLTLSPSANTVHPLAKPNPLNDTATVPRHPYSKGFNLPPLDENKRLEIFALLSSLPLIDSALLRRLRIELNWGGSELEHSIWQHSEVCYNGLGIYFPNDRAETYRAYYPHGNTERFWQIVQDPHQTAFQGLKNLEGVYQYALEPHSRTDISDYYQRLIKTLHQTDAKSPRYHALQAQAKTVLALMPKRILETDLNGLIHHLAAFAYAEDIANENWQPLLALDLEINQLDWKREQQNRQLKTWQIVQLDQEQLACSTTNTALNIITLHSSLQPILIENGKQQQFTEYTFSPTQTLSIKTDSQHLELSSIEKPAWASEIWRDAQGLFVRVTWAGENYTLPWRVTEHGDCDWGWIRTPFGKDNYGVYADLTINKVTQRFRWIEAGTFLMGSPEDEPERYDNETQHQVTLTHGYWLADTACTQALWQAVMGNNPAGFKGENNPVERVSWDDAQDFLTKLNQLIPNLNARLPTEAEWEYACRAGTTTPFSFGDNITPEQVNYDGNASYNGAEKGLYREYTVPVKSLPANDWGLYEMHGNVYELCNDWYGDYLNQAVTNPTGATNGERRVLRGGSWYYDAGRTRSAYRNYGTPDDGNYFIGFRFALGQTEAGKSQHSARTAEWNEAVSAEKDEGFLKQVTKKIKQWGF